MSSFSYNKRSFTLKFPNNVFHRLEIWRLSLDIRQLSHERFEYEMIEKHQFN